MPASVLPYYDLLANFLTGIHFDLREFILDNAREVAVRVFGAERVCGAQRVHHVV